jgi:hypothetical protein
MEKVITTFDKSFNDSMSDMEDFHTPARELIQYYWNIGDRGKAFRYCNKAVGEVLTISKTCSQGHCYIARSVSGFLQEFYPAFEGRILAWITNIYDELQTDIREESSGSNTERRQKQFKPVSVTLSNRNPVEFAMIETTYTQTLNLEVLATSGEFALEVKSALKWTFAVLQEHKGSWEGLFDVFCDKAYWSSSGQSPFEAWRPQVTEFNPTRTESYCWTGLFSYACIAELPAACSSSASTTEGLEIDFDLLLSLAAVDRKMVVDDGIILFGFDTALVPLDPPESRRWHFLTTEGRQITPMRVINELDRLNIHYRAKISDCSIIGRVFVGWCSNPVVRINTTEPDAKLTEDVSMASGVPDVKRYETCSKRASAVDISFRIGAIGSMFGLSGGIKREKNFRQVAVVAKRTPTGNFERILDSVCNIPCILWDNSISRAWLLPTVSVLLFASLQYIASKGYTFKRKGADGNFEIAGFQYAQLSADTKRAAVSSLRQNKTLQVDTADGEVIDDEIFFEDIVRDIWIGMSVAENECSDKTNGRRYESDSSLFGYDLKDAIFGTKIHLRALEVTGSIEAWKPLVHVKQTQVIFCKSVGPVITCSSSACSSACCEQESTRGVLSCLFQDLNAFYGECWDISLMTPKLLFDRLRLPIRENFEWIPCSREAFKHLDGDCSRGGVPCACCENLEGLQSITARKPKAKLQRNGPNSPSPMDTNGQIGSINHFMPITVRFGSIFNYRGNSASILQRRLSGIGLSSMFHK